MKNIINKSNRISTIIFSSILIFGIYFLYSLVTSTLNPNGNITSNQVWCSNCQTYHDRSTAAQEESQRLVWCVNCNKYHAPNQDN